MFEILGRALAAFNSKARPWQISLAVALALIPGLSPFFTLHNLFVFFLAFFLNINIGVFFVAVAVFSGIAYLLDPLMEMAGYSILTLPALEATWTAWYNNPWMGLTRFNNSLVIGSLALAMALFLPAWLIFHAIVKLYRGPISRFTEKIPVVRLFLAYDTSFDQLKKPLPIRWIGALVYVVIIGGISLFILVFMDPLVKKGLEIGLSRAAGASVEIDSLDTSLNPLALEIRGLQVPDKTDAMRNLAQAERIALRIDSGHLLQRRFLLDEVVASGVALDQPRQSPARILEPAPKPPATEPSAAQTFVADVSQRLPEPRDVVRQETLHTRTEGQRIEQRLEEIENKWQDLPLGRPDMQPYQERFRELEQQARTIRSESELRQLLEEARTLQREMRAEVDQYEALLRDLARDRDEARQLIRALQALPGDDFDALREKYSFDADGAFELAGTLLGEDVQENLENLREWYYRLSPYVEKLRQRSAQREEQAGSKPSRGEGRIVHFTLYDPKPGWLIANAALDITTGSGNQFAGRLQGMTDNQRVTGRPMEAFLQSSRVSGYDSLRIDWVSERRQAEPLDTLNIALRGYEKSGSRVDRLFMSPSRLQTDMRIDITSGGTLSGRGVLHFLDARLGLENPGNELERIIHRTLDSVSQFDVDMRLSGRFTSPRVSLSTDLDRQLSNRFRAELDEQRRLFEQRLKAELEQLATEMIRNSGISEKELEELQAVLRGDISTLQALEQRVGTDLSEKALKARLDAELQRLSDEQRRQLEEEKKKLEQELRDQIRDEGQRLLRGLQR